VCQGGALWWRLKSFALGSCAFHSVRQILIKKILSYVIKYWLTIPDHSIFRSPKSVRMARERQLKITSDNKKLQAQIANKNKKPLHSYLNHAKHSSYSVRSKSVNGKSGVDYASWNSRFRVDG